MTTPTYEQTSRRSTPSLAVGGVEPQFACVICGKETCVLGLHDVRGFCCEHCPDHDFEYDRYRTGHFCNVCDAEREYEPSEDDVGFGSLGPLDDPIGVPASTLNGNAMAAKNDPGAWDRWVRISESWGHP